MYTLFYNKSLFDAEGLRHPGEGSWTWDDYLKAVKKITKDLDGDGTPDQWGATIDFWGARLYPWLWSNGADLMSSDLSKCTIDSPDARQALQFLVDLRHKHKSTPSSTSTERNEGLNGFAGEARRVTGGFPASARRAEAIRARANAPAPGSPGTARPRRT